MAMANMNLIGVFVTKLWPVQALACGGGGDGGGATKTIISPKFSNFGDIIIRIITGAKYDAHTEPLFKTAKLLNLDDIYRLQISKYMFCYMHNTLPKSLNKLFSLSNETHTHVTRYHTTFKLTVNKTRTMSSTQSILHKGPDTWTALASDLYMCKSALISECYFFHMMANILIDLTIAFVVHITGVGGWHGGSGQPWITRLVFNM